MRAWPMLVAWLVIALPPAPAAGEPDARAIVRFADDVAALPPGVRVLYAFASAPAFYVEAPAALLADLSRVARVEPEAPIEWALATATIASGARDVLDPAFEPSTPALAAADGGAIDGRGVGIAIVDSGIDGTHPDLADRLARNFLVTPAGLLDAPYTAEASPHGTHVAGIAAGTGAASGGLVHGAAPGASLYGFAIAPAGTVAFPAIAFDWILQHGATLDPPIRIVSNSWGCRSGPCALANGERLHVELARELARSGVTVVWAAGNDGGDGFVAATNLEARDPTPGIVSVAAYDDDDRGLATRCVASFSSRGDARDPSTWPDVAAPGTRIFSAYPLGADANTRNPVKNTYREMSGTSMAAPHVAGIAALLLHARPSLAPADVEFLLKSTARKLSCGVPYLLADPTDTLDGANHVEGHGLVDARAAVDAALAFTGIPEMPPPEAVPDDFGVVKWGVRPTRAFYLRGDALSAEPPDAATPAVLARSANERVVAESAPLDEALWVGGLELDAYVGTLGECPCARFTAPRIHALVEVVPPEGAPRPLMDERRALELAPTAAPVLRELVLVLAEPVALAEGERLRVTLTVTAPSDSDPTATWLLYADSATTPTRLLVGDKVRAYAGSAEACQIREDCARIGGERNHVTLYCGLTTYRVAWEGPAGSGAAVACNGSVASCRVAGDAWGTCEAAGLLDAPATGASAVCSYFTADGAPAPGRGRCEAIVPED